MDPAHRFADLVGGPPTGWQLDQASAMLAAGFTGHDRTVEVRERLDDLAAHCAEPSLPGVLAAMRGRLTGNVARYDDPRNSFVDEVLERGVGLPITLGVIAIEVARRVGATVVGIGPPRHFLVRDQDNAVFGDPFRDGTVYGRAELRDRWEDVVGPGVPFDELFLVPMTERSILIRMLNNLKALALRNHDLHALVPLVVMRGAFVELADEAPQHATWVRHWN
jgi:regulator of sirC expression with transglutaminase-like and TPR domain